MPSPSMTRMILRSIFSWKMLFMLIGTVIVFGGVFVKIMMNGLAMAEMFANMPGRRRPSALSNRPCTSIMPVC